MWLTFSRTVFTVSGKCLDPGLPNRISSCSLGQSASLHLTHFWAHVNLWRVFSDITYTWRAGRESWCRNPACFLPALWHGWFQQPCRRVWFPPRSSWGLSRTPLCRLRNPAGCWSAESHPETQHHFSQLQVNTMHWNPFFMWKHPHRQKRPYANVRWLLV